VPETGVICIPSRFRTACGHKRDAKCQAPTFKLSSARDPGIARAIEWVSYFTHFRGGARCSAFVPGSFVFRCPTLLVLAKGTERLARVDFTVLRDNLVSEVDGKASKSD
jgi:hypothetical protein